MIALNDKARAVLKRLLKGFIGGATSAMVAVTYLVPTTWEQIGTTLNMLAIVAVAGGIGGLVLALNKWVSWKDDDYGTL